MDWGDPVVRHKLARLLAIRYTDDFAHLGIGEENPNIIEWEDYLKSLGIGTCIADFNLNELREMCGDELHVAVEDPFFMNVVRIVPKEIAEKILVFGAFPDHN